MENYTISSPLRKIERFHPVPEKEEDTMPSFYSFERLNTIFQLSPQEILDLQRYQFDYICGVAKAGHPCKNSFYCQEHSFEEKLEIPRSLPLPALISDEIHNKSLFRKKRRLVKFYHDCKAYWRSTQSVVQTPETCSRTSCVAEALDECTSTQRGSQVSAFGDDTSKKKYPSLKRAFLKNISKPSASNIHDRVSYLLYRLSTVEKQDLQARARELEVRFSNSEY